MTTNRVTAIRTAIQSALSAIHDRVYYKDAKVGAVFPYLVFALPNSTSDGELEQFVLDVDGWDDDQNTLALETLMYNAELVLNKKAIVSGDLAFIIRLDNRLEPEEKESRLQRRKYIFQIKVYEGGN